MASVSISKPVATGEGVEFIGSRSAAEQKFQVHRQELEDLDCKVLETPQELLQAFSRHQSHIAQVAGKALDAGQGGAIVVLQSLL